MSVPSRGRDDVIFGTKEKRKEPPLTPELQRDVDGLDGSSTMEDYKRVGNKCFSAGNFSAAIKMYTKALELDPQNETLLSNRSASYLQSPLLSGPTLALKDADKAIAAKPTWYKAHLRKADALYAMKKTRLALEAYQSVLSLDPSCTTAVESIRCCQRDLLVAGEDVASPSRSGAGGSNHHQEAESCPYNAETHRAERRVVTEEERLEAEKHLDTETLVKTWSKDTDVEAGTTACKKRNVNLAEADRETGKSYKEQLMNSFRKKVSTDDQFHSSLSQKKEQDALQNDGLDFRRDADAAKRQLAKGTDGVGLAISAEAYKAQQYKSQFW